MASAIATVGESRSLLMSRDTPIVFVVDDDVSVRESLESLIRLAGWQPETFASAQEFLARPRVLRAAWYSTSLFRASMVSICRSASPPIGSTCRSSSSRVTAMSRCRCRP